jgi:hypothetical protein
MEGEKDVGMEGWRERGVEGWKEGVGVRIEGGCGCEGGRKEGWKDQCTYSITAIN